AGQDLGADALSAAPGPQSTAAPLSTATGITGSGRGRSAKVFARPRAAKRRERYSSIPELSSRPAGSSSNRAQARSLQLRPSPRREVSRASARTRGARRDRRQNSPRPTRKRAAVGSAKAPPPGLATASYISRGETPLASS